MTPDLRQEAEMLARRSCQERQDYLYEVECCRGPEEAEALAREVMRIKGGGCTDEQRFSREYRSASG